MSLNQKNIPDDSFKRTDLAIEDIYGIVDNCCEGINKYQTAQGEICVASLAVEGSNVHKKGQAVVGKYPYDIAVTKVGTALARAKEQGFPFRMTVEEA